MLFGNDKSLLLAVNAELKKKHYLCGCLRRHIASHVEDKEVIPIHLIKILATILDDLLHMPFHRDDAIPVEIHR